MVINRRNNVVTYTLKEHLIINFSLATGLLIFAQLETILAEVSFLVGGVIYLATFVWMLRKIPFPSVSVAIDLTTPPFPQIGKHSLPEVKQPKITLPRFSKPQLTFSIPRINLSLYGDTDAIHSLRPYLILITISVLLGFFYYLSFIRFLNANNGISMFYIWQGLN